jgi:hypothetical protein
LLDKPALMKMDLPGVLDDELLELLADNFVKTQYCALPELLGVEPADKKYSSSLTIVSRANRKLNCPTMLSIDDPVIR